MHETASDTIFGMIIPPIDADALHDFEKAKSLEWLETNGLGGFASQTACGAHTRRYHGLFFAALRPPTDRVLLLSRVEESLIIGDTSHELGTNQYKDAIAPKGCTYLSSFTLDPFPVWTFAVGNVVLEKTLFMTHGKDEVTILYRVRENPDRAALALALRPLIAGRDMHALLKENNDMNRAVGQKNGYLQIQPYVSLPLFSLSHNASSFDGNGSWYKNFFYTEDAARGYDALEDLYCIGTLQYSLSQKQPAYLVSHTKRSALSVASVQKTEKEERTRRLANEKTSRNAFVQSLAHAADQFIVKRGRTDKSIIAGYHWFTDWGRDTMISIPGLLLTRSLANDAKKIVITYLKHMSHGMIPNRFPDFDGQAQYNTVDATLWLFQAVRHIMHDTGDARFLLGIFPKLQDAIRRHEQGTRFGIHTDPEDGLLSAGEKGVALTWMDAVADGRVVTPRRGKPVEVNALWYNALCCMAEFAALLKRDVIAADLASKAKELKSNFRAAFWNDADRCLYDCIGPDGKPVAALRPNQLFAVSLRDDLLTREQQRAVLDVVTKHLLTPVGLRSLSPHDPQYRRTYEGNPHERDAAYHQGTVWGWLIGPYIDAYLTVYGRSAATKKKAKDLLKEFQNQLSVGGLGQLSEIFDGDPPHAPRGCIAQAWTVAEMLRVLDEL